MYRTSRGSLCRSRYWQGPNRALTCWAPQLMQLARPLRADGHCGGTRRRTLFGTGRMWTLITSVICWLMGSLLGKRVARTTGFKVDVSRRLGKNKALVCAVTTSPRTYIRAASVTIHSETRDTHLLNVTIRFIAKNFNLKH